MAHRIHPDHRCPLSGRRIASCFGRRCPCTSFTSPSEGLVHDDRAGEIRLNFKPLTFFRSLYGPTLQQIRPCDCQHAPLLNQQGNSGIRNFHFWNRVGRKLGENRPAFCDFFLPDRHLCRRLKKACWATDCRIVFGWNRTPLFAEPVEIARQAEIAVAEVYRYECVPAKRIV